MEKLDLELLEKIADLHGIPEGSFNIRKTAKDSPPPRTTR